MKETGRTHRSSKVRKDGSPKKRVRKSKRDSLYTVTCSDRGNGKGDPYTALRVSNQRAYD